MLHYVSGFVYGYVVSCKHGIALLRSAPSSGCFLPRLQNAFYSSPPPVLRGQGERVQVTVDAEIAVTAFSSIHVSVEVNTKLNSIAE